MLEIMFGTDPSFDALFTVAVRTTGIYCRPSCNPPRKPKAENVEFYPSPSEAKAAGFRGCKLCRPDGPHPLELEKRLVRSLMTAVTLEPHLYKNVNDLVRCAGVSSSTRVDGSIRVATTLRGFSQGLVSGPAGSLAPFVQFTRGIFNRVVVSHSDPFGAASVAAPVLELVLPSPTAPRGFAVSTRLFITSSGGLQCY